MSTTASLWFVLIYLFAGILFLLCYLLALKPASKDVQLGLIAMFWPVVLLIDIGLALSTHLGATGRALHSRFKKG